MMPHPERYVDNELGGLDGFEFLKRTLEQLSSNLHEGLSTLKSQKN